MKKIMNKKINIEEPLKLRSTIPFKLKDKEGRTWKAFDLKKQFGFLPESIIISKMYGMNNTIVLSVVLTEDEKKKAHK